MKSARDLTAEQKQTVFQWAEEGASLQEIQKRLDEEFKLRFTFMETRFLAGDLNLPIKSEVKEEPVKEDAPPADSEFDDDGFPASPEDGNPLDPDAAAKTVPVVTVDQITAPGTLISGKVVFAGGKNARWALDQYGRLSLDPDDLSFRPSQPEIIAFQQELQRVARKHGL